MYRFCLFAVLVFNGFLFAQVEVSTSLPTTTFLKYEGIPLRMVITNNSGETIRLGDEDAEDMLILRVRDLDNRVLPRTKNKILPEPWIIKDGETSVRTFDLVQLFTLSYVMSYRCLQDVKLGEITYTGSPLMFEVVRGLQEEKLKRRKEDRVYTLLGIHRNGHDELMLRVTNYKNTMVLATYYLERHLKFYDPFMEINKEGILATLQYISPNRVVMCRFNPDGTPIGRTYYSASPGVPIRLVDHPQNGFMVQGGVELNVSGNTVGSSE